MMEGREFAIPGFFVLRSRMAGFSNRRFFKEKATEDFLEFSLRLLRMPDGTTKEASCTKLVWLHYEFALKYYSHNEIMEMVLVNMAHSKLPFEAQLQNVVGHIGTTRRTMLLLDNYHPDEMPFPILLPYLRSKKAAPIQ